MSSPINIDDWIVVRDPVEVARESRLAYKRKTIERLDRLLQNPKITAEIRQEHQLLLDNAERERRSYNYGVYVEDPDMEDAMFRWEDKKVAAAEAERVRQRKSRQKWRRDAAKVLELKRRSKLRRPPPSIRMHPSLFRRRRKPKVSPMQRWRSQYERKSRIISPGQSNIVRETRRRRRRRIPRKRKRSPFVKRTKGGKRTRLTKRTRRTRRTLRRKRRKTRKHK
mgnify:CR=1 FL=1